MSHQAAQTSYHEQLKTMEGDAPETPQKTPPPPQATHERPVTLKKSAKRESYLSWNDYFMGVAFLTAMRSKDPSTQVGAVIVNGEKRIVGVGYNGFPSGIPDEALPWEKASDEGELETKYPYVCHAELNAVMNKNVESCKGCVLYSTLFPCSECAKVIIQSGIRHVVFASDKHSMLNTVKASKRLFALANVELSHHSPNKNELRVPLRYPEDGPAPEPQEGLETDGKRAYEQMVDTGACGLDGPVEKSAKVAGA